MRFLGRSDFSVSPSHRLVAVALIASLGVCYLWLAFRVLEPDAVHSIDTAVKYVQACTVWDKHFVSMGMSNRGEFLDPAGVFFPFRPPFVFRTSTGWQSIFPTAASLLLAPMTPWGLTGITLPAIAGAVLLLWATYRVAFDVPLASALPLVLGAGTMLWYYGVLPNEHAPAAALTTAALALALWRIDRPGLAIAGVLVGIASLLRDESILIAPGLLVARYLAGRRRPGQLLGDAVLAGCATIIPIVLMAIVDTQLYQRPPAVHLLHATGPLQRWLPAQSAAAIPDLAVLTPAQRFDVIVQQWLVGVGTTAQKAQVLAILAVGVAIRWMTGSALGLIAALGYLLLWRLVDATTLLEAPKFVGGLYRLCPFVIFAVLPLPPAIRSSRARRLALVTAALFLAVTFLTINTIGGKPLGPRLLMPIIPLIVLAAWEAIVQWTRQLHARRADGVVGLLGLGLLLLSVAIEVGSTIPAFALRNHSDYISVQRIVDARSRILVIDSSYSIQLLTPLYRTHVVLLAQNAANATELATRLYAARVPSFTLLSRAEHPALTFAPYTMLSESRDGRLVVQQWRR
jgi:hypothetical protein